MRGPARAMPISPVLSVRRSQVRIGEVMIEYRLDPGSDRRHSRRTGLIHADSVTPAASAKNERPRPRRLVGGRREYRFDDEEVASYSADSLPDGVAGYRARSVAPFDRYLRYATGGSSSGSMQRVKLSDAISDARNELLRIHPEFPSI